MLTDYTTTTNKKKSLIQNNVVVFQQEERTESGSVSTMHLVIIAIWLLPGLTL